MVSAEGVTVETGVVVVSSVTGKGIVTVSVCVGTSLTDCLPSLVAQTRLEENEVEAKAALLYARTAKTISMVLCMAANRKRDSVVQWDCGMRKTRDGSREHGDDICVSVALPYPVLPCPESAFPIECHPLFCAELHGPLI